MPESLPEPSAGARPRFRSVITTMIMITVMIVRDILVRRWGSSAPPAADVTRQSR
jgi:hypothetical protein